MALAERVKAARPRTRLGGAFDLPIIFAGNVEVRQSMEALMAGVCDLRIVDNVRPVMEVENLGPARDPCHGYRDPLARLMPHRYADLIPQIVSGSESYGIVGVSG